MQLIKSAAAMLVIGLMFSSQASAILINDGGAYNGIDVGSIDTLVATTTSLTQFNPLCVPGSSEAAELCWATSVTGDDYTLAGKAEDVEAYTTNGANVIAFQLLFGPGTYIVKNATSWGLFTNLADVNWGVIDTSSLSGFNLSDTQLEISHVTEFNGDDGGGPPQEVVSEPASLFLLAIGLLGLGGFRRFKNA